MAKTGDRWPRYDGDSEPDEVLTFTLDDVRRLLEETAAVRAQAEETKRLLEESRRFAEKGAAWRLGALFGKVLGKAVFATILVLWLQGVLVFSGWWLFLLAVLLIPDA